MIDDLFALRMTLEHDLEGNQEKIDEIDRQLVQLGVEMLSTEQVSGILGDESVVPLWEPESTDTVQWSSRKLITTYRGYHYEVQILEGVPISVDSPLRLDYTSVSYNAEGITAGITKAIIASAKCYIEDTAIGAIADFAKGALDKGITFLNMLEAGAEEIEKSLATNTVLERVKGTAVLSFTGHMKYVYVKPYETTDANYQGLYYFGNAVSCLVTTVSIVDVMVDGKLATYHSVNTSVEDVIQSLYYDDYSKAVANYCDYNYNNNKNFKQDYTVRSMHLSVYNNTNLYSLPWTIHPNIIFD